MKRLILMVSVATAVVGIITDSRATGNDYQVASYTYDDEDRLTEIITNNGNTKIVYTYDDSFSYSACGDPTIFNDLGAGISIYKKTDNGWIENTSDIWRQSDGNYAIWGSKWVGSFYDPSAARYGAVINRDGKIIQEGIVNSYPSWYSLGAGAYYIDSISTLLADSTYYTYDEETGERTGISISDRPFNVGGGSEVSDTTLGYHQVVEGNIVKEYIGEVLIAVNTHTEAGMAARAAKNCGKTKSCTSCSGGKFLQEGVCVAYCGSSFRLNDGECDRIRYTPAEAAQYLKDTDNTIIMTFKVNR